MQAHISLHTVDTDSGSISFSTVVFEANRELFEVFNVHRFVRSCFCLLKTFHEHYELVDYMVDYSCLEEKVEQIKIYPLSTYYNEVPALACSRFFANAQIGYVKFLNKHK